jgi:hypothetical protein
MNSNTLHNYLDYIHPQYKDDGKVVNRQELCERFNKFSNSLLESVIQELSPKNPIEFKYHIYQFLHHLDVAKDEFTKAVCAHRLEKSYQIPAIDVCDKMSPFIPITEPEPAEPVVEVECVCQKYSLTDMVDFKCECCGREVNVTPSEKPANFKLNFPLSREYLDLPTCEKFELIYPLKEIQYHTVAAK